MVRNGPNVGATLEEAAMSFKPNGNASLPAADGGGQTAIDPTARQLRRKPPVQLFSLPDADEDGQTAIDPTP